MTELVNPSFERVTSSERLEVLEEADGILQEFKSFMQQAFPKASSLYENAKWLWQDIHDLRTKRATDAEVDELFQKQRETWTKLQTEAAEMQESIQTEYVKVSTVEERIKKARGSGPSLAALGFPTPQQKAARYVYNKKFKYAFHDGKSSTPKTPLQFQILLSGDCFFLLL